MNLSFIVFRISLIGFFSFFYNCNCLAAETKSRDKMINHKKFIYGYTFKGHGPIWSENLCKILDYNSLQPSTCKKANDNIGNKSIICNLHDKSLKLAAYLTIDDCKVNLQMSSEGDTP